MFTYYKMFGNDGDMVKTIGLVLLILFITYIVLKALNLQPFSGNKNSTNTLTEGFVDATNPQAVEDFNRKIAEKVTTMKSSLLLVKNRNDYEDMIALYQDFISLLKFNILVSTKIDDTPTNIMISMNDLSRLDGAAKSLSDLYDYYDTLVIGLEK